MDTASRKAPSNERPRTGRRVRLAEIEPVNALERARHAFGQEGFTALAEIDLRDGLGRKIDRDIGPYWVMELCHPVLASQALAVDRAAGLPMLFKVAVWQEGKDAVVATLEPEPIRPAALAEVAREAEEHIDRALDNLATRSPPPA